MKIGRILLAPVLFFLLMGATSCTSGMDSKIDAPDTATYKKNIENIKKNLSPEEAAKLDEALQFFALPELKANDNLFTALAKMADISSLEKNFLQTVDGKTPRQIIEMADRRVKKRQKKELDSINSEIAELETRKKAYASSRAILDKIKVEDAKFYISDSGFIETPTIDFKITNNTGIPLSRVFFHGTVSTPGRSVPWISEDFNYSIRGGLEHGEKRHLKLDPNRYSSWGGDFDHKNSVFIVEVVNAMDADGKEIAAEFGKKDEERILSLMKSRAELEAKLKSR